MLLLNSKDQFLSMESTYISIHLMLLLNRFKIYTYSILSSISIHLMLLLNICRLKRFITCRRISIHLMLLLNSFFLFCVSVVSYFNTSYVVIKLTIILSLFSVALISIHLMLLLNKNIVASPHQTYQFQYILCCY